MPALSLAHLSFERRVEPREAADACGLSLSWFHRIFRDTMGMSYAKFCVRARLGFAARQLLDTDLSVEVIAEQTGFADASHRHHHFTRQYRWTPAQYRGQRVHPDTAGEPGGPPPEIHRPASKRKDRGVVAKKAKLRKVV